MKNILVLGYYYKNNLGDTLFMEAFQHLFPNYNFSFRDQITTENLLRVDAVFIGGGSLLDGTPSIKDNDAWELLKQQNIFYIGVGAETDINVHHYELMQLAKLIAIRSPEHLDKVLKINPNTIVIPDLVYSLPTTVSNYKIDKSILVMPNALVIPTWNEPHWKHAAWEYFKNEFAQFLDELIINKGYTIYFAALSTDSKAHDGHAGAEIVNRMVYKKHAFLSDELEERIFINNNNPISLISRHDVTISQRYHGIVLSHMSQVPCIAISHHDKLKNISTAELSFYGISKDKLHQKFDQIINGKVSNFLPIDTYLFEQLKQSVEDALCHGDKQ